MSEREKPTTDQVAVLRGMMAEGYGGPHFCEEVEKGCQEIERLLTVLRFIAQDPKAVSPVQAARDALADYGDQHVTE